WETMRSASAGAMPRATSGVSGCAIWARTHRSACAEACGITIGAMAPIAIRHRSVRALGILLPKVDVDGVRHCRGGAKGDACADIKTARGIKLEIALEQQLLAGPTPDKTVHRQATSPD